MSNPPPLPLRPSQKPPIPRPSTEQDIDDDDDESRESTYFDANDVFYDETGKRVSMRYSLAVISSRRTNSVLYAGKRGSQRILPQLSITVEESGRGAPVHEDPHGD